MIELKLVKGEHPALTSCAEPVEADEDVGYLIQAMREVILKGNHRGPAIGLAANQVGVLKRVIALNVGGFNENIINPEITRRYGGKTGFQEESLSFPGLSVLVIRHKQIVVEGFNEEREPVRYKLKDRTAKVVQHVVDVLDGITIRGSALDH